MSYVHSESQSLWPLPVVVSSPKGNFTMGTTESGRVIPMIRSKNICSVTALNDGSGRSLFVDHSHRGEVTESRILSSGLPVPDATTLERRERAFVLDNDINAQLLEVWDNRESIPSGLLGGRRRGLKVKHRVKGRKRKRKTKATVWVLKEIVGIGGFGIVFATGQRHSAHSNRCVCKTSKPEAGWYGREMLLHEGEILAKSGLVDCFLLNGRLHLVMPRLELWTEQKFFVNPLHSTEKLFALNKLSSSIAFCHSLGFAHCDLKPDNILVVYTKRPLRFGLLCCDLARSNFVRQASLCDFGFAVDLKTGEKARGGTLGYMPPSLKGDPRKIDVYSFGIVAWELWTGKRAFQKERELLLHSCCDENEQRERAIQFLAATRGKSPDLHCLECATMPEEVRLLLSRCWLDDPDERPEMEEICDIFQRLHLAILQSLIVSDGGMRVGIHNRWAGFSFDFSFNGADRRIVQCTFLEAVSLFSKLLDQGQRSSVLKCLQQIHYAVPDQILRHLGLQSVLWKGSTLETLLPSGESRVRDQLQDCLSCFPDPGQVSVALAEAEKVLSSDSLIPFDALYVGVALCAFPFVKFAQEDCLELIAVLLRKSEDLLCHEDQIPLRVCNVLWLDSPWFFIFTSLVSSPLVCVRKWGAFLCQKWLALTKSELVGDLNFERDGLDASSPKILAFFKRLFESDSSLAADVAGIESDGLDGSE